MNPRIHDWLYRLDGFVSGTPRIAKAQYLHPPLPAQLNVGLTNYCNAQCTICLNRELKKPRGFMSAELFNKIVAEAAGWGAKCIGLGLFGEAILHPEFMSFIRLINGRGLWFQFGTNGIGLSRPIADFLIREGWGRVRPSLFASSPEDYKTIHGVDRYETAVENLKYFLSELAQHPDSKIWVRMEYTLFDRNRQGFDNWLKLWKPYLDGVRHTDAYTKQGIDWQMRLPPASVKASSRPPTGSMFWRKPCGRLFDTFSVDWDGEITACCASWNDSSLILGNANEQSLREAWTGPRMTEIRKEMLARSFSDLPVCQNCHDTMGHTSLRKLPGQIAKRLLRGRKGLRPSQTR